MNVEDGERKPGTLFHNIARTMDECLASLRLSDKLFLPPDLAGPSGLFCNGTWDGVLCWPATPANATISLPCPPLRGLDATKSVRKQCVSLGVWEGHKDDETYPIPLKPSGWTDYSTCFAIDPSVMKDVARGTRKLEFVGLGLSFFSLITAVSIFTCFRRLRNFRNMIHLQLMIALLMVVIVRLTLYVDLVATESLGSLRTTGSGFTINTKPIVCESFYFALEYFKTVTFAWMFIEGFYLHNTVVVTVFSEEPQLWRYLVAGWGIPFSHTSIWLLAVVLLSGKVDRCLGSYYLNKTFWILDGFRLLQLVINTFFLLNIVRVLWLKVRESHSATELEQLKKSVKAALMLVPLLGIPNIMQTIPFTPNNENINYFAVYTYIASIFYMFQGFMIAIIYCFTNREVIHVLKSHYQRYRLQHSTGDTLRRGSRAASVFYQKNGQLGRNSNKNSPVVTRTAGGERETRYSVPLEPDRPSPGVDESGEQLTPRSRLLPKTENGAKAPVSTNGTCPILV